MLPYFSAVLIFLTISLSYFAPPVFEGKKLKQTDVVKGIAAQQEIIDYRKATGEEALWTNSMFSGMPAYQISVVYVSNFFTKIRRIFELWLPGPANYIFLYLIGFYILMLVLGINPWLSILGAVAFAFSSYFFIIIDAGHIWKVRAIAFIPPTFAGILLAYQGKFLKGGIIAALFLTLQLYANHPQMTYYFMMFILIYVIGELIYAFRNNKLPVFFKASGILLIAAVLAFSINITRLLTTYQYGEYTIRGGSELTFNKDNKTSGLDRDYVTAWSYGQQETFSLLVPNIKGGGDASLSTSPKALEKVDRDLRQAVGGQNHYWGNQPFTSGPVYVGAFILFLFVLGMFIVKGRLKWVLFSITVLAILLSWGKNMMWFTDLFLDYFPMYNKFRAVSSILVMAEFAIPVLALITLNQMIKEKEWFREKRKEFYAALGLTAGLIFLFYLFPGLFFSFLKDTEIEAFGQQKISNPQYSQQIDVFLMNLEGARISIFRSDVLRSLFIILTGAALLFIYGMGKLKSGYLIALLSLLVIIDMWGVDKRYLNDDDFVSKRNAEILYHPTNADKFILKDKDPNYRVMNTTVSTFNDASTSYFHKSIGGYHGAKLQRYQDIIDNHILKNNMKALNMLNTKYFIVPDEKNIPAAQLNMDALGNSWFVEDYQMAGNADEEIMALNDFDPAKTAIIDRRFENYIDNFVPSKDSLARITLTSYEPNHLTYSSVSGHKNLAVFSEIYYDKGWDAFIDGKEAPYFRVNYVLRGMIIPAGEHVVEFKFEPAVYYMGEKISGAAMIILLLVILGYLARVVWANGKMIK